MYIDYLHLRKQKIISRKYNQVTGLPNSFFLEKV